MLTIGGLPEEEALHWNDETYQAFGSIVFKLCSGKPEDRQKGFEEYHEMRRHFMNAEWSQKLRALDEFRAAKNLPKICDIASKIGEQLAYYKKAVAAPECSPEMPATLHETFRQEVLRTSVKPVDGQLSLF